MRPSVVQRGGDTAPILHLQGGLRGVIVGKRAGLDLIDVVKRNVYIGADRVSGEALVAIGDRLAVSATVYAAGDVIELIEVAEVEEVAALRSNISDLDGDFLGELRFDVEVVRGIPRRYQFLVDGEDAARRIGAKDRCVRGNGRDDRGCKADAVEGRPGLAGIGVVSLVADKEVLRRAIVVNAAAGSYY